MHGVLHTAFGLLASLAIASASGAQGCDPLTQFSLSGSYASGTSTYNLDAGDVNGDGIADIVAASAGTSEIVVHLGLGAGSFLPAQYFACGGQSFNVKLGDIDHDGDLDALVADVTNDTVNIMTNDGAGAFTLGNQMPINGSLPSFLKLIDLDSDGNLDAVSNAVVGNAINIFFGAGDGTFAAAVSYAVGAGPQFAAFGDVDNDGDLDMATPNLSSDSLSLLLNHGDGTFAAAITIPTDDGPVGVSFGDVDGDGNLDLVESINGIQTQRVRFGAGNGTFPTSTDYAVIDTPGPNALADLDGDGDLDIATTFLNASEGVKVLINDGTGVFSGPFGFDTGGSAIAFVIADLNSDFAPDIATADIFNNSVGVLHNTCGPYLSIDTQPASVVATAFGPAEQIAVSAPLATSFQWYFNDSPISDDSRFSGSTTDTLTINPRLSTEGEYHVEVTNNYGTLTSMSAVMAVINDCPADQNLDGILAPADFTAWIANYNLGCN